MGILFVLIVAAMSLLVSLALPIAAFLRASRVSSELAALRARLAAVEEHLRELSAAHPRPATTTSATASAPEPQHGPEHTAVAPLDVAVPVEVTAPLGVAVPPVPEPVQAHNDAAPLVPVPLPVPPAIADAPVEMPTPIGASDAPRPRAESTGEATGLEEAIGGRLLLYVGTTVLVLGAAFFLKYAFERAWITESTRVVLGGLAGVALVAGGLRIARAGYSAYGQVLIGGGLAVLYLAVYAAFGFYELIGSVTAFVLLTIVTGSAALLADRQESQPMAVMAIGGGFLTPFLVGGTTDAQVTLFSYVTLLLLGTLHLARRRGWPMLNVFGYALTIVTVAAWANAYYAHSKYLRTELFITGFCALFLVGLADARRLGTRRGQLVAVILWTAPMLYHAVSLGILARHGVAFLVYLIAFTVITVGWATRHAAPEVRVLLWLAVLTPLVGWIETHQSRAWIAPSLATLGAVFALHLLAQLDRLSHHPPDLRSADVDLLLLHLNGLGLFVGVYVLLERQAITWVPVIGVALVALHAALASWLRPRHAQVALHALAVAFALLAATVGVKFDGAWLTAAWAAEGAAVMWIGLRVERNWFRAAGAALVTVAAGRWLALSVLQPVPANFRLFVNEPTAIALWLIVLAYALAWAHRTHRSAARTYSHSSAALVVAASVVTVILLTAQNQAYWQIQGTSNSDATFARQLVLSLIWALYAGLLIAIGIRRGYRPIRYTAIVLFGITVVKVFLSDLAGLEGIYRVFGLLAVGTILLLASFLYQRRARVPRP